MKTYKEVLQQVSTYFDRNKVQWALEICGLVEPPDRGGCFYRIYLKPPGEKSYLDGCSDSIESWARDWITRKNSLPEGVILQTVTRKWRTMGRQQLPAYLEFASAHAVAAFLGKPRFAELELLTDRFKRIQNLLSSRGRNLDGFPEKVRLEALYKAIKSCAKSIEILEEVDFERLLDVVRFLCEGRSKGLRPRMLPVVGVDSKWFSLHKKTVLLLAQTIANYEDNDAFGIIYNDDLVRIRILDETLINDVNNTPITDFSASIKQLNRLNIKPKTVFIFENLESVLSLPELESSVVIHGSGYAVSSVSKIRWLQDCRILYWGDLDVDGFKILSSLRSHIPQVQSLLMDSDTWNKFNELAVPDPNAPKYLAGKKPILAGLRQSESELFETIYESGLRLEQERIGWNHALASIRGTHTETSPQN